MNWKVFFTRLGSAIVFAAVMMLGLLYPNAFAIFILALLIQFLCLKEFFKLMQHIFPDAYFPRWLEYSFHLAGVWLLTTISTLAPLLLCVLIFGSFILLLAAALSRKTALTAVLCGFAALIYISLPLGFLVILRNIHFAIPLAVVLMIWMNDTMAYIVGSFIGKHSFSPISPKKTWEGTLGGAALTLIGAGIWGYYCRIENFDMADWLIMALFAVVAGTAGDLLESKLKRLAGAKDSGNIMPGHGGALDRFDSLLITLPFVFCYVYFFMTKG
jgi:phosphatidate cytidylyltransferase